MKRSPRSSPRLAALSLLFLCAFPAVASAEEDFLELYAATFRFSLGTPREVKVTPDGSTVLFLRSAPRDFVQNLYAFDIAAGEERLLLSAEKLLGGGEERLTAEEKARRERQRLVARGIAGFELSRDGRRLLIPLAGALYLHDLASAATRRLDVGEGTPIDPRLSPDARSIAFVRDGELHVADLEGGAPRPVTRGAGNGISHGTAEFVAQEEMSRHHGYWWSPDSRRLVFQRTDTSALETMHIADGTHPERAPDRWPYPRPGKPNAEVTLGIVPAAGGEVTWIEWDRRAFEYVAVVRWDEGGLRILVQNRRQTEQRLLQVDPDDGTSTPLIVETDPAWVEIDARMPFTLDAARFLWTTEREGFPSLELRGRDGRLVRSLTPRDLGFTRFAGYLPGRDEAIVEASADPTRTHVWALPLDGGAPRRVSERDGVHTVATEPGTQERFVIRSSPLDGSPEYAVTDAGGEALATLRDVSVPPPFDPRLELTTVGEHDWNAVLVRPRDFDPGLRYPVIVHVYGGPTSLMVRADKRRYLLDQWFADQGFVVVAVDGRGTPGRGRDWHRAVHRDLITVPMQDQAAAVTALAAKYPELDGERVGIYGWSFGGYFSALAVMMRPDLFRAGVAGAPVTDWADYDTHYTERYLGLPEENPRGYEHGRVMTHAAALERPLLVIHGTADDNVYFMHSLKLADALFRAGKDFDFLPLPGFTHMVPDPLVTRRLYTRIRRHFEQNLGDPRSR